MGKTLLKKLANFGHLAGHMAGHCGHGWRRWPYGWLAGVAGVALAGDRCSGVAGQQTRRLLREGVAQLESLLVVSHRMRRMRSHAS